MNCPSCLPSPPPPPQNNNLSKPKGFLETEMSKQNDLHCILPLYLSRCISVIFNTQAAHQHPGSSLHATGEVGKEPMVIWTVEEVDGICLLLTLNNHNQIFFLSIKKKKSFFSIKKKLYFCVNSSEMSKFLI